MGRNKSKRVLRYGTISLLLCALVIASLVIVNVIAAVLSLRYEWMYQELGRPEVYEISDGCTEYIEQYVTPIVRENGGKIKIIFCDTRDNIRSEELYKYVYDSFFEVAELFPDMIEIEHLDVFEKPSVAQKYGVDSINDVVCVYGDRHETLDLRDFYAYDTVNYESVVTAYNGEILIASALMRVTQKNTPMCYITVNHGEEFDDQELLKIIAQAGYTVGTLDLYSDEIPEDCEMLVTFNPKKDFTVSNETSQVSEVERLEKFMSNGGKYMVFLSADTFASGGFVNMESFLASWGVSYMHKTTEGGVEACYLVKDSANSLTSDGYTVVGRPNMLGNAWSIVGGISAPASFGNTTYMSPANGYISDENGNFVSGEASRKLMPLYIANSTAVAWADGRAVTRASEEDFILMSLTETSNEGGRKSYLLASSSIDFASGDALQSASLGNGRIVGEIIRYMGKDDAPSSLVSKPMGQTDIESLTTRDATIITVVMAALPMLITAAVGTCVIVRRKNR